MSKISRRNFLAASGAAAVAAMGAGTALAATSTSADTSDAMNEAEEKATSGAQEGVGVDDSYVVSLKNGLPKWSFEIAPDPIADEDIAEVVEDDIIVVGAGMAGICTTAAAAEKGASVTLFSASSQPISRGGSNFSAYNKVIEEYGIDRLDPVDFFYHEERAASFTIDQKMWMRGYNNSEEAMNWCIDIVRSKDVEVFLESDNRLDNGPDYAIGFGAKGDDTASASTGQQNAVEAMEAYALEQGATIIYDTVAKQLVRDEETGRVTAVVAQKADGSYVKFVGHKGIVLATGGGAILRRENRKLLRDGGLVIFLDRSPWAIRRTLRQQGRPLLTDDGAIFRLARQRRDLYRAAAHHSVNKPTARQAAEEAVRLWREEQT